MMVFTNKLAIKLQTHYLGEIAFSWFRVAGCHGSLQLSVNKFSCVDVETMKPYECWKTRDQMPKKLLGLEELSADTKMFVKRLLTNLDYYFEEADDNQMISMNLHPLMHWCGFV